MRVLKIFLTQRQPKKISRIHTSSEKHERVTWRIHTNISNNNNYLKREDQSKKRIFYVSADKMTLHWVKLLTNCEVQVLVMKFP